MKQQFFKFRNILTGLTLMAGIMVIAMPASAKGKRAAINTTSIQPLVQWIGSDAASSLFLVKLQTETPVNFQLVITDAEGAEIFRKSYESAYFEQYFKLVNEGFDAALNLNFSIETYTGGAPVTYTAKSPSPLEKEVIITRK